jgi:signal transduction histidine kinase
VAREPVDLAALLGDAIAFYEPLAEERAISLGTQAATALVEADRDLLFQAVANLLDNALKFTPPGGAVRCEVTCDGEEVCLNIVDSGPGIPTAQREQVLQRFARLDDSRSTPGNGLGLPLVLAIARRHGGSLELAEGLPGNDTAGLRATLRLPGARAPRAAA